MPILWRYLLRQYTKIFFLSLVSIIAVLLMTRLDDIAHFAALGASLYSISLFTLYQIPYILPIAIPVSCLIASALLVQRLSKTHELTAMRASGFSTGDVFSPLLFTACFLALINLFVVSEVATTSHLNAGTLKTELRSINPLFILNNKHLMRLKGMYVNTLGRSKAGESAEEMIVAMPGKHRDQLNILIGKRLETSQETLSGEGLTFISPLESFKDGFDDVFLENISQATGDSHEFSSLMQKKISSLNNDHLRLPLLLMRLKDLQKNHPLSIAPIYSEILRRLSSSLAAITFTLMGFAFGIHVGRGRGIKNIAIIAGLATLYLMAFFAAKSSDGILWISALFYLGPHVLIGGLSFYRLRQVSLGVC